MSKASIVVAVVVVVVCVGACGSSSSSSSSSVQANPCATKGATYLVTFTEMAGGTCGPVPQSIINVSSDGTVSNGSMLSCTGDELTGCTERKSGCTSTLSNGCSATVQTDITFAPDGATASGLETAMVTCPNGSTCTSTYQASAQRQ